MQSAFLPLRLPTCREQHAQMYIQMISSGSLLMIKTYKRRICLIRKFLPIVQYEMVQEKSNLNFSKFKTWATSGPSTKWGKLLACLMILCLCIHIYMMVINKLIISHYDHIVLVITFQYMQLCYIQYIVTSSRRYVDFRSDPLFKSK